MAFAEQALLEQIFNIGTFTYEWCMGLFVVGSDPRTDLALAEVPIDRHELAGELEWSMSGYLSNNTVVSIGPVPSCTVGGWFITNGLTNQDVYWVGTFIDPVAMSSGDYLIFDVDTIVVNSE